MDCGKVGRLIYSLRKEKGLTQKQLADTMNISDKAISKWERGLGCPDVSLLRELSAVLGVNIEKLLSGDLNPSDADGGNMKRLKFYVCPQCGNVLTASAEAELSCCGRKLAPLKAEETDAGHQPQAQRMDGELYVTWPHEMIKAHHIAFAAYLTYDRVLLVRLYPEQDAAVRIPELGGGKLYYYCTQHGLFACKLQVKK